MRSQATKLRATFAASLRGWREKRKMTQQAVAEGAGLTQDYVSMLETEKRDPSFGAVEDLAKALSIEPWQLLKGAP